MEVDRSPRLGHNVQEGDRRWRQRLAAASSAAIAVSVLLLTACSAQAPRQMGTPRASQSSDSRRAEAAATAAAGLLPPGQFNRNVTTPTTVLADQSRGTSTSTPSSDSGSGVRAIHENRAPDRSIAAPPPPPGPHEPSPPGGLGDTVGSFGRRFGRPLGSYSIRQPSYAYGAWPLHGAFIILDNDLNRAVEVHINFTKPASLKQAEAKAAVYLPSDTKLVRTFDEASTGDHGTLNTSKRLAETFPETRPAGYFVLIYDGTPNQITGIILRMGASTA